jgi:hypothetical protein
MGRIRTIKPEILTDEKTAGLNDTEWRLFVSCLAMADDYGNFRASPAFIHSQVFWASNTSREASRDALESLARLSLLVSYTVNGQQYAHIVGWSKHQRVDHPGKPVCPGPEQGQSITYDKSSRESRDTVGQQAEDLAPDMEVDMEREGNGKGAPPPVSLAPQNEPGKPSPRHVVSRYLAIRAETLVGQLPGASGIFVQPQEAQVEKAASWLASMAPDDCADIEPAMRLACEHVRNGKPGWSKPEFSKVAFLFGAIVTSWPDLREELHNCAPKITNLKKAHVFVGERTPILER